MSMPAAPGVYVGIGAAAPNPAGAPPTGTWFVTGEAQQGPVGVAIPITSMTDYANFLGSRAGYTNLYDSLDEYFHDGGVLAYVSRVVGPSAVNATLVLKDTAGTPANTLSVTANGAGVWGNSCTVAVAAGTVANTFVITIKNPLTGQTWISPNLFNPADAVTWATNSAGATPWAFPFVIANLGSVSTPPANNPAVISATVLATGADDLSNIIETQWTAALTAFVQELGPGQVSAPGHNSQSGWEALIAHASATDAAKCLSFNRIALLDTVDSASASTVVADAVEAQAGGGDGSFGMFCAPWIVIPGVPATTVGGSPAAATRVIPPSALVAALIARSDRTFDAGVPAAGANGQSAYAVGVTQVYNETDRGTLNTAGVVVIRQIGGVVEPYGWVTLSANPAWVSASFARMRMAIVSELNAVAQTFAFAQIDGQGHLLSAFNGALAGVCQALWQEGALYGANAADAFNVNTGTSVNTPTTIAAGQLNAVVSVKFSPYAEFCIINVVQYSVNQTLPS